MCGKKYGYSKRKYNSQKKKKKSKRKYGFHFILLSSHYYIQHQIFALYFLLLLNKKYISPLYYILGLKSTILRASYTKNTSIISWAIVSYGRHAMLLVYYTENLVNSVYHLLVRTSTLPLKLYMN